MNATVLSSLWYRVAGLQPSIAAAVRVDRQRCRGEDWHLLQHPHSGRSLRLNRAAYAIAGRFTGTASMQRIWEAACSELGDLAPTQDECIDLLARLHEAGMLDCAAAADFDAIHRQQRSRVAGAAAAARNPLALRIALGDPTRLLRPFDGIGRRLFSPLALAAWLAAVAAGGLLAAAHWPALTAHAAKWLATPRYLLIALAMYPLLKALHELMHAVAIRRFGGEVRRCGITLMFGMPLPFVDAADASSLPSKRARIVVSAAGIMLELAVAVAGLALWLALEPGLARDIAFVAACLGVGSTLAFNANPLLRFDGYYVLTDALELPNLARRSARYWAERFERGILRLQPAGALVPSPGERPWLIGYAPLSLGYRLALLYAVVFWIGRHSPVLACLVLALILLHYLLALVRAWLRIERAASATPWRVRTAIATSLAAIAAAIALVPAPHAAVAQGVVWIGDDARVRAGIDGFVIAVHAADGAQVTQGAILVELDNPALRAELAGLRARVDALETELFHAMRIDAGKAQDAGEALEQARAELARAAEKVEALAIRAGSTGRLAMPRQGDLLARAVRRGDVLGHVLAPGSGRLRVAVPEEDAALLRTGTRSVSVRLRQADAPPIAGELVRDTYGATRVLPSAALAARNGGAILTDPDAKEADTALSPLVVFDVQVAADAVTGRGGQRVWVRFDQGAAPLAQQWGRRLRQALLQQFDPS